MCNRDESEWFIKKSNLNYTCVSAIKSVTSGGVHLRGLAPGQHSSRRNVAAVESHWQLCLNLTGLGIIPQTSCIDSDVFNRYVSRLIVCLWSCRLRFDSESGQTNDLKLAFTAFLLDVQHKETVWRTSRQVYLLCCWKRHLAGFSPF